MTSSPLVKTSVLDEHYSPARMARRARCAAQEPESEKGLLRARARGRVLHQGRGGPRDHLAQGRPRRAVPQLESRPRQEVLVAALEARHRVRTLPAPVTCVIDLSRPEAGVARPAAPGDALIVELPLVPTRLAQRTTPSARAVVGTAPSHHSPADIEAGLRRLRLSPCQALSPELLVTAEDALEAKSSCAPSSKPRSPRVTSPMRPGTAQARQAFPVSPRHSRSSTLPPRRSNSRPSTTWPVSSGSGPRRICALSVRPAPARTICSLPSGLRSHRRRASASATSTVELAHRDPLPGSGRQLGGPAPRPGILKADLILIDEIGRADGSQQAPSCSSASSPPLTSAGRSASGRTGPSRTGVASSPSTPPPSACSTGCSTTTFSSSPRASRSA